jgi:hypothetical protein
MSSYDAGGLHRLAHNRSKFQIPASTLSVSLYRHASPEHENSANTTSRKVDKSTYRTGPISPHCRALMNITLISSPATCHNFGKIY